jgi:photosystem II stability/assembly factor-like uncharacterized protein
MRVELFSFVIVIAFSLLTCATSWSSHGIPVSGVDFYSAAWSSALTCTMIGYSDNDGGVIIKSLDGALTWTQISPQSNFPHLADIATTLYLGKRYYITVSSEGNIIVFTAADADGASYSPQQSLSFPDNKFFGVTATSGTAYVVGQSGSQAIVSKIYKSVSTASSIFSIWKVVSPALVTSVTFTAVSSFDGTSAIVVGFHGTVFFTRNGGQYQHQYQYQY